MEKEYQVNNNGYLREFQVSNQRISDNLDVLKPDFNL